MSDNTSSEGTDSEGTDFSDTNFEELEQIPWAELAARTVEPGRRYLALALLGAVVLAGAAWFVMRGSDAPAAAAVAPTTAAPEQTTTTTTASSPETVSPAVYSEADLMAIDVAGEERLAAMHAEWLVRDYLTVDGDPVAGERVAALLPGVERPDTATYVEWVEPYTVSSDQPGRYRVELVYRTLTETEDGYVRQPAGAVAVELSIDTDGAATVETAPEPVPVPEILGLN